MPDGPRDRWRTNRDENRALAMRSTASLSMLLRDGRVLLAGGFTGVTWRKRVNVASAALYDPKMGQWSETRPMKDKRAGFSIIQLSNGQVLVAGGWAQSQMELKSAELFDSHTETWRPAAPMTVARRNHRAALLAAGDRIARRTCCRRFDLVHLRSNTCTWFVSGLSHRRSQLGRSTNRPFDEPMLGSFRILIHFDARF